VEHVQIGYFDIYTKGGKIRRIYIPKTLRKEATEWFGKTKRTSGYLFLNRFGERITTRGIAQQLKNYTINSSLYKFYANDNISLASQLMSNCNKTLVKRSNLSSFVPPSLCQEFFREVQ
jgi:site-specific recombinase XerD